MKHKDLVQRNKDWTFDSWIRQDDWKPLSMVKAEVAASLRAAGMSTIIRWNLVFCTPPLVIGKSRIAEGLEILDQSLTIADQDTVQ